jgi:hypothetical protein
LVLGEWGGAATVQALEVVMKYIDEADVAAEAATAAVAIAEKVPEAGKAQAADAMKKVVAKTKDATTRRQAQKILAGLK